ncbi:MAG: hemerythrin domain-containing protein [Myxococcota bacterium]
MKATMLLKRDHQTVSSLFRDFERLRDDDHKARRELFLRIKNELDIHTRIEEEIFYPELFKVSEIEDLIREARTEHDLVKDLCNEIARLQPDDPDYIAKVAVLRENVEHHVEEEEGEMFPLAKKHLSGERLEKIAQQLEDRKEELARKLKVELV